MSSLYTFNEVDAAQFYHFLAHQEGEYTEIRAIEWTTDRKGKPIQHFVNNEQDFIKWCRFYTEDPQHRGRYHVYAGVNPRLEKSGKAKNISRVTGVPFDIDAPHPKDQPATEQEITQARETLENTVKWMAEQGYNEPYQDFTGNGYRILQAVDIPVNENNRETVQAQLHAYHETVALNCTVNKAVFDKITDLPRIVKVPGTWSVKGEHTPERPHRRAQIHNPSIRTIDKNLQRYVTSTPVNTPETPAPQDTAAMTYSAKLVNLRPCFRRFVTQGDRVSTREDRTDETAMRFALVEEAYVNGFTEAETVELFKKADDFDRAITRREVNKKWSEIKRKGSRPYKCTSIRNHGACLGPDCQLYERNINQKGTNTTPELYFTYNKNGKVTKLHYDLVMDKILEEHHIITFTDSEESHVYDPETGLYNDDAIPIVKIQLKKMIGNEFKRGYSEELIYQIKILTYVNRNDVEAPEELFPLKNGILNLNTRKLVPYTPDYYFTARSETEYNPDATPDKFLTFISELECDKMATVQEFCGYLLLNSPKYKKALFIYGPTDSGKTTFSKAIFNTIGHENTCSIAIQNLDNRFQEQRIYQKRANIVGDLGSAAFKAVSMFKRTTGGDLIEAEIKGANKTIRFVWNGKHWFDANDLPDPQGDADTDAFYNRLILAAFTKKIPLDQQNKDLPDELNTPEELSGILNWMLEGLDRLEKQRGFTDKTSIDEIRDYYKRASNTVYCFTKDLCKVEPDNYIHKGEAFRLYAKYCIEQNFGQIGKSKFYEQLQANLPAITSDKKTIKGLGFVHVFLNLTIEGADISRISTISTLPALPPSTTLPTTLDNSSNKLFAGDGGGDKARGGNGESVDILDKMDKKDSFIIDLSREQQAAVLGDAREFFVRMPQHRAEHDQYTTHLAKKHPDVSETAIKVLLGTHPDFSRRDAYSLVYTPKEAAQ